MPKSGLKVFVYWNLHRKLWSARALEGPMKGRVVGHFWTLALKDASFKVSEAGRQRVLREGKKNVHAGVVGRLEGEVKQYTANTFVTQDWPERDWEDSIQVTYNPRKYDSFVVAVDPETKVSRADHIEMNAIGRVHAWGLS